MKLPVLVNVVLAVDDLKVNFSISLLNCATNLYSLYTSQLATALAVLLGEFSHHQ